ncbi:unnamed protein product [Camellia sinensis]
MYHGSPKGVMVVRLLAKMQSSIPSTSNAFDVLESCDMDELGNRDSSQELRNRGSPSLSDPRTYYAAVIENCTDFVGRVGVDVGAGSSILSLFAAHAGAKHVYAVEASEMAKYARKLIAGNPLLAQRITVVKGKVEEVELPEKADILISEPMGTLLVNERMLETYVIARDRFLVPNGKMFPTIGRIHMAQFSDEYLYVEIANKALFWQQRSYYEVDLTPLYGSAFQGYFSQPVVDAFDPSLLVAPAISHMINFTSIKSNCFVEWNYYFCYYGTSEIMGHKGVYKGTKMLEDLIAAHIVFLCKEEELYEIDVPLKFKAPVGTRIHGLACWFDVLLDGSTVQRWLSTAPGAPTAHWYQLHCVLSQPLYVMPGQEITGQLHMIAHNAQEGINIQIQSQDEEGFELMHQPSQNKDIEYTDPNCCQRWKRLNSNGIITVATKHGVLSKRTNLRIDVPASFTFGALCVLTFFFPSMRYSPLYV